MFHFIGFFLIQGQIWLNSKSYLITPSSFPTSTKAAIA